VARSAGGVIDLFSIEAPVHSGTLQSRIDRLYDLVRSREHVAVPEAKNAESSRSKKVVASRIVSLSIDVLASVEFDNDRAVQTGKVSNVEANLVLSPKLESSQLSSAQATPEEALGVRQLFPQASHMALHDKPEHLRPTKI
jgi:hypothetical protein